MPGQNSGTRRASWVSGQQQLVIGRVIALLRSRGEMAILLVQQYFDFVHALAQRIAVMDCGEIVLSGRREELDEHDVRRRLPV